MNNLTEKEEKKMAKMAKTKRNVKLSDVYSSITICKPEGKLPKSKEERLDDLFHCLVEDDTEGRRQGWRLVHFVMPDWKLQPYSDSRWADAADALQLWAEKVATHVGEGAVLSVCAPASFPPYVSGIVCARCTDNQLTDTWVRQTGAELPNLNIHHVPDRIIGLIKLSLSLLPSKATDWETMVLTAGFTAVGDLNKLHREGARWTPEHVFTNHRYLDALIKHGRWEVTE